MIILFCVIAYCLAGFIFSWAQVRFDLGGMKTDASDAVLIFCIWPIACFIILPISKAEQIFAKAEKVKKQKARDKRKATKLAKKKAKEKELLLEEARKELGV